MWSRWRFLGWGGVQLTLMGPDIGTIVDVVPYGGNGLGDLVRANLDAGLWFGESLVSAVALSPYRAAYEFNTKHPKNPFHGALSAIQRVSLGWDIGWDQLEQRTRYPGASVNDEGVIVNKLPTIFMLALDSKGRIYVVKVTYGPKTNHHFLV